MLVLLSNIVLLTQIDEVDNRLGSQEEEWVDELYLEISSVTGVNYSPEQKSNFQNLSERVSYLIMLSAFMLRHSASWDYQASWPFVIRKW
jgi:hypothetical protein